MSTATISAPDHRDQRPARPAATVDEARRHVESQVRAVGGIERVALRSALGRTLAEDVIAPFDVPAHTNSGVDGYAFGSADMPSHTGGLVLHVAGTAWAGRPYEGQVGAGECIRIMTGAPMPRGADTVVMQEHARRDGDVVRFTADQKPGANVRPAGEDLARGQVILSAGREIGASDLGLLASIGRVEVAVRRRLRVAFFSTGDELRSVGQPLSPGELYDSNRYTLYGLLSRPGVETLDLGVVSDDRDAIRQAFLDAGANADAIITSGGVSVGEADYVKEVLAALGEIRFWQIAMKPGRPLAFGRVRGATFFGLPGNPVAVMVTFCQIVEPALRRMMGQTEIYRGTTTFKVHSVSRIHQRKPGRTEFLRAVLARDASGELVVRVIEAQGSGILSSMSTANCFVILPPDGAPVETGDLVDVQPFHGIF